MSEDYEGQGLIELFGLDEKKRAGDAPTYIIPDDIEGDGKMVFAPEGEAIQLKSGTKIVGRLGNIPLMLGPPIQIQLPDATKGAPDPPLGVAREMDKAFEDLHKLGAELVINGTGATDAHLTLQAALKTHEKGRKQLLVVPPADHEETKIRALPGSEQEAWARDQRAAMVELYGEETVSAAERVLAIEAERERINNNFRAEHVEKIVERSYDKRLKRRQRVALRMQKGKAPKF